MHSASEVAALITRMAAAEREQRAAAAGRGGFVAPPPEKHAADMHHTPLTKAMSQTAGQVRVANAVSPSGAFAPHSYLALQAATAQAGQMPLGNNMTAGSLGGMGNNMAAMSNGMQLHPGNYSIFAPRTPPPPAMQQRSMMFPMHQPSWQVPPNAPQSMMTVPPFNRPVYPMPQRRDSMAAMLGMNNSASTSLSSSASTSPHSAPRTPLVNNGAFNARLTASYQSHSGATAAVAADGSHRIDPALVSMARVIGPADNHSQSRAHVDGRDSLDHASATPEMKSVPVSKPMNHAPKARPLFANKVQIRVKLACASCKLSKTKCDDERPCRRCVRTDRAATCLDSEKMNTEPSPETEEDAAAAAPVATAAPVAAAQVQPTSASSATPMSISASPPAPQTSQASMVAPAPAVTEAAQDSASSSSGSCDPAVAALTMLSTPPASAPGSPKPEHPQPAVDAAEDRPNKKLKGSASTSVSTPSEDKPSLDVKLEAATISASSLSVSSSPLVKVEIDVAAAPAMQVAPSLPAAAVPALAPSGLVSLDSVPRPNPWMPTTTLSRSWCDTWTSVSTSHLDIWREHLNARASAQQSSNPAERDLQSISLQRFTWLERAFNWLNVCVAGMVPPPSPVPVTNMSGVLALESLEVPKSLYSQLNLGVVLFPLGQPPFATNALPWCNQSLANLLGFANGEELVQTLSSIDGIASLYHASNLCSALPTFIDAVMEGRPNYSLRSRWKHRAGNLVDMLESLNLTFEASNGHVLYVASLMQPIPGPMTNVGATAQQVQQQTQMQQQQQQQQMNLAFPGMQQSMVPQLPPQLQMMPHAQHFHFNVALQPPPPSLPFYYSSPNQPPQQQVTQQVTQQDLAMQMQAQMQQQQPAQSQMQSQPGGFQSSAYSSFPMQSTSFPQFNVGGTNHAFARPMPAMQQQQPTPPLKSFSTPIPALSMNAVPINATR